MRGDRGSASSAGSHQQEQQQLLVSDETAHMEERAELMEQIEVRPTSTWVAAMHGLLLGPQFLLCFLVACYSTVE